MRMRTCCFLICCFLKISAQTSLQNKGTVKVLYTPAHPANIFDSRRALGAAFDGHEKGDINKILTPLNIKAMQSVGLGAISYRLRTELAGEVWHWNPHGSWSEAGSKQGYWVSDSNVTSPINLSYGYRLPRRGNTIDHANDDGYSRLDDGDKTTYWKSNPYLDEYFTKESNTLHPQWAIVDLGKLMEVNAIRIIWGNPYAISYKVDYALDIGSDYFEPFLPDLWHSFSSGNITDQKDENKIIPVSQIPLKVRFIRITATKSSYTSSKRSNDIRDKLGIAITEIEAGLLDKEGKFHDWITHRADHKLQSKCYVSSTDPWHRSLDIDHSIEQAGIDKFFNCGLTGKQPTLMPIGILYDTPENMTALLKYILAKHYNVNELELGEEPEGQLISPVDYASLYYQWAKQLKQIMPQLKMGGPGFATLAFTERAVNSSSEGKWTTHFLDYLKKYKSINLFNFFTFEWYPFDDICAPTAPQLAAAPQMLNIALKDIKQNVLPDNIPIYMTEYGYSAFSGKPEVDIEGALMYADIVGKFLTMGGNKCFLYGYEPAYLETEGCGWGNNMLFMLDDNGKIKYKTAAYYGMHMLTHDWTKFSDSILEIYPVTCDVVNEKNQQLITAYAIRRANNTWSIILINKDPKNEKKVEINIFNTQDGTFSLLGFPMLMVQYSGLQYHWMSNGDKGYPSLSLQPLKKNINNTEIILPPYSLTVITASTGYSTQQ